MAISIVGCGTSTPIPLPTLTSTPSLVKDIITPAVTLAPSPTSTPIATATTISITAPIRTPYERRPLPATWTPTATATVTLTKTPTLTPTITLTPTATFTRTVTQLCDSFKPVIMYDAEVAYPRETIFTVYAGIDDPTYSIVFEAIEQITGESLVSSFSTNGLYSIGELTLINFPVLGTYDWTFWLETEDGERLCPVSGVMIVRDTTLFDLIPTGQPEISPTP